MSIYVIDVHVRTHTCPADPEEHEVDIRRSIVHLIPGRPCQRPVTVRSGNQTVTVPCGRHEPPERHCDACRTLITTRTVTVEYLGYQGPDPDDTETGISSTPRIPTGNAPNPCDSCGEPLDGQIAAWGRHLLCPPPRTTDRTTERIPKHATRQPTSGKRAVA